MERTDFIIDIQAFHDKDGDFLPKEIAILALDYNFISHWTIKPPYGYDKLPKGVISSNSYLTCYRHGLEWYDGESALEDVYSAMRLAVRDAQNIYVRGHQKVNLLERVLGRNIVNLEDYSCPSFENLPQVDDHFCTYHGRKADRYSCALAFAYKLRIWLRKTLYTYNDIARDDYSKKKKKPCPKKPIRTSVGDNSCASAVTSTTSVPSTTTTPTSVISVTEKNIITTTTTSAAAVDEPYYSKPYDDEHPTATEGSKRNSRSNSGCISSRSIAQGVDETGCYHC